MNISLKKLFARVLLVMTGFIQFTILLCYFYSDVDECTASSPVCDVNAQCSNTRGSYSCRCKVGYSGSGKTCKGLCGGGSKQLLQH